MSQQECLIVALSEYVTGSTKTVLIAQDRKFNFFTQTKLNECTIKFHCHSLPEWSGLLLLAAFSEHSGEPYEWSGVLMEPWPTR